MEPETVEEIYSAEMYGYSGLHYLRRIAAHIWNGNMEAVPGNADLSKDVVLKKYYDQYELLTEQKKSIFNIRKRKASRTSRFEHLIIHSDTEGYYIPLDFEKVIVDNNENLKGGMLGSSIRLKKELEELAAWLELDLGIDEEADEVWEATETQGTGIRKWERFAIESFCCLRLYRACEFSILQGSAIVFS